MNYQEHVEAAAAFMRAEDALSELGMDMATVEVVWGAAIQVIHDRMQPRDRIFVERRCGVGCEIG